MIYALVTMNVFMVTLAIWGLVVLFKYFPRERSDSFVYFNNLECYLVKGEGDSEFIFVSIPVTSGNIQLQITGDEISLIQTQNEVLQLVQFPVTEISKGELMEKFIGNPVVFVEQEES